MKPEPTVRVTRYEVSCLPPDHQWARHFALTVERRGNDLWAVCWQGECLGSDGAWDYEPLSSARTDAWLAAHRFDLDEARALAKDAALKLTVAGLTVADVLAGETGHA